MIALKLCVNLDNLDYSSIICRRVHLYADDECFYNGKHSSNGFTAASRPANVIFESIQIWIPVAVTILSFIHICIYTCISHVCAHVCVSMQYLVGYTHSLVMAYCLYISKLTVGRMRLHVKR